MPDADTLYRYLLKQINSAAGVPVQLDSEAGLALRFGVSRWVARGVLRRCVREGLAEVKHGRGYFVCPSGRASKKDRASVGIAYGPGGAEGAIESVVQEHVLSRLIAGIQEQGIRVALMPIQGRRVTDTTRRMIDKTTVDAYLVYSLTPTLQALFARCGIPAIVYGATHDDLGLPNVALNLLEITRELTEQLFASGHNCVCLLQERTSNIGWERSRLGFEYAHSAWQIRFKRERIIRIDRRRRGLQPAVKHVSMLAPSGMLVQNAGLLEQLWNRADHALQKKLAAMEIVVLNPDYAGLLKHPASVLESDARTVVRITTQLLVDVLQGRPPRKRHHDLPWNLVSKP